MGSGAKRGSANPFFGPRLPNGARPDRYQREGWVRDPAHGEAVGRCRTCGMPDRPESHLMDFALWLHGKHAGSYTLCERCFRRANPDFDPIGVDPLDVQVSA